MCDVCDYLIVLVYPLLLIRTPLDGGRSIVFSNYYVSGVLFVPLKSSASWSVGSFGELWFWRLVSAFRRWKIELAYPSVRIVVVSNTYSYLI